MEKKLTHIKDGDPGMVDVGDKQITRRSATARSIISFPQEVWNDLTDGGFVGKKGPILHTALIAGIQAAKRTHELIPMCHPLALDVIDIQFEQHAPCLHVCATCRLSAKTGVEMEALMAASIAALTIYDMCKALSHNIIIEKTELIKKTGGKSDIQRET